jgi:hypothetical protein
MFVLVSRASAASAAVRHNRSNRAYGSAFDVASRRAASAAGGQKAMSRENLLMKSECANEKENKRTLILDDTRQKVVRFRS